MTGRYPSEPELEAIRRWDYHSIKGVFDYIKSIWEYADWGWHEENTTDNGKPIIRYKISTGGWSGNEEILSALRENHVIWSFSWVQSRRGGHYIFEINP